MLIEPNPTLFKQCVSNRNRSSNFFINKCLVPKNYKESTIEFYTYNNLGALGRMRGYFYNEKEKGSKILLPAININNLLKQYNIKEVNFFSIDVEGADVDILDSIDFNEVNYVCILVEIHHCIEESIKYIMEKYSDMFDITIRNGRQVHVIMIKKSTKIGSAKSAQGLGDILLLTAICKYNPNCIVELTPMAEKFSTLFDGICQKVIITENPTVSPDVGTGTYIERKLTAYGIHEKNAIPYIQLTEKEKENGVAFAKKFKNPIVFVSNCSQQWKHLREMKKEKWVEIIERFKNKYTFLHFGTSENYTEFENTIPILNLPIKTLSTYYYGVGRYLGVDTGDRHLMSAVGGKCIVVHPPNCRQYKHACWHYAKDVIKYVEFNNINQVYHILKSWIPIYL